MDRFTFTKTSIEGVYTIEAKLFADDRGYFMQTYNTEEFIKEGLNFNFVMDNHVQSKKGVLRGLHFQYNKPQGKLVKVIKGKVFDVAVDLRKDSDTYGKWEGIILSEENKKQFYIPEGFAHGILALSDEVEFLYKCTDMYDGDDEGGIIWNDPDIGIEWPLDDIELKLSEKDKQWKTLKEAPVHF
jgi:dTDP-4-dehydrorhamnose 3,5-epimerase